MYFDKQLTQFGRAQHNIIIIPGFIQNTVKWKNQHNSSTQKIQALTLKTKKIRKSLIYIPSILLYQYIVRIKYIGHIIQNISNQQEHFYLETLAMSHHDNSQKPQFCFQNILSPNHEEPIETIPKAPQQNTHEGQKQETIQQKIWKMLDIGKHILKRKIILMILTAILALSSFIFTIILATSGNSFFNTILNINIQSQSLLCAIAILIIATIFCVVIYKGNILMLHCYWILCLFFFIIFVIVASNAYSVTNQDCENPTAYIFQQLKLISISSQNLFCSANCPCENYSSNNSNATMFNRIQDCPGWTDTFYTTFFKSLQSNLQCSGWCNISPNRYFTFIQQNSLNPSLLKTSCFVALKDSLLNSSLLIKVVGIFQSVLLILIILYTNYYIFMQKQDQERQKKRLKKELKNAKQRLQDELKTSKRLIQ